MKTLIILGSTGSIGLQALDLIWRYPKDFRVAGLAAGRNQSRLKAQAEKFSVNRLALGSSQAEELVRNTPADLVLNAITGAAGLTSSLAALDTGKTLALANKESLVIGGHLLMEIAKKDQIIPIDSEHSALAQANRSGRRQEIKKLILTASGGPFRSYKRAELEAVTPGQALKHPTWSMGVMVTTNSATLMNKGLEIIEAHWLFDMPYKRIEVVIHPQSVVHSMTEFYDGSTLAQLSPPNMTLPIAYALNWPNRLPSAAVALDFSQAQNWQFYPPNLELFPALELARRAGEAESSYPAVLNAANEVAVEAFHARKISFLEITRLVGQTLEDHRPKADKPDLDQLLDADGWARKRTQSLIDLL